MKFNKIMLFTLALMAGNAQSGWFGINTANLSAKFNDFSSKISSWTTNNPKTTTVAVGAAALVAGIMAYKYWTSPVVKTVNIKKETPALNAAVEIEENKEPQDNTASEQATIELDRFITRQNARQVKENSARNLQLLTAESTESKQEEVAENCWISIDEETISQTTSFGGVSDRLSPGNSMFTRIAKIDGENVTVSGKAEYIGCTEIRKIQQVEFKGQKINLPKNIQIDSSKLKAAVLGQDGQIYLKNDSQKYWNTGLSV